jgi:cytochrome P450
MQPSAAPFISGRLHEFWTRQFCELKVTLQGARCAKCGGRKGGRVSIGSTTSVVLSEIVTPPSSGFFTTLLNTQPLPALAARIGAWISAIWGKPIRIGSRVLVARHAQVLELLGRDLDFQIGPINAARIDAVNGPFILGMDRGATLTQERRALYSALSQVPLAPIEAAVAQEAAAKVDAANGEIDVVGEYARLIAAHTARRLFGIQGTTELAFIEVARAVFAHTFLNLTNDKAIERRALIAAGFMKTWFAEEIARRRASGQFGTDLMGRLLTDGILDDDGIRRTLGGMLVGSIDTTSSSVAKIVWLIGKNAELAKGIAADAGDPVRLAGWCCEALRLWPHNPLVQRQAVTATQLANVVVRPGDQMIAWTQAAMRDPSAFPEPDALRPDRPVGAYLHFGGGLHPCAGRAVNAFQIPLLVGALLRRGIKSVGSVQWAGPFPDHLILKFEH